MEKSKENMKLDNRAEAEINDNENDHFLPTTDSHRNVAFWNLARYRLCMLCFLGMTVMTMLRFNLSIAIVEMVQPTVLQNTLTSSISKSECYASESNRSTRSDSSRPTVRYDWDTVDQGYVLASFFYGYVWTQVIGGVMADRYSPRKLFGLGLSGLIVLTLVTPLSCQVSVGGIDIFGICFVRALQGAASGFAMPAPQALWAHWAPPDERGKLAGGTFSGTVMGIILSQSMTGFITKTLGWQMSFYILGGISALWIPLWFTFASDTPAQCRRISKEERDFLAGIIQERKSDSGRSIPWSNILCSVPFWAIMAAHFSFNYLIYTFLTILPMYLKQVHGFDISTGGYVATLPYICLWICIPFQAKLAAIVYERNLVSVTTVRRVANSISAYVPSLCLLMVQFVGCQTKVVVGLICGCVFFTGFAYSGYLNPNVIDLAPNFAGTLFGLTNTFANLPGFIAPQAATYFIKGRETLLEGWSNVWITSMAVSVTGATIYALTASGKKQKWNDGSFPLSQQFAIERKQFCDALNCRKSQ